MNSILVVGSWEGFAERLAPLLSGDSQLVMIGNCADALRYLRTSPAPAMVFGEFNAWQPANYRAFLKEFPHIHCVELIPYRSPEPANGRIESSGLDEVACAAPSQWGVITADTAGDAGLSVAEPPGESPPAPRPEDLMLMLAHDLRAAISVIAGYAGVLTDREGTPRESAGMLERIRNTCQRLIGTVDDVVRIMRAGERGAELELSPVTPHDLIHAAIEDLSGAAEARRQTIHCDLDGSNEPRSADRHLITLVLRNLLHNAVKFTRPGGVIVVKGRSEPGGLSFQVQDDGQGIAPTLQSTLFDRVKRFLPAQSGTGTGIGLWSARKVVDLHGGAIWVKSTPGRGSVFGFTVRSPDGGGKRPAAGDAAAASPKSAG